MRWSKLIVLFVVLPGSLHFKLDDGSGLSKYEERSLEVTGRKKGDIQLESFKIPLVTLILVKLVNIKLIATITLIGVIFIKKAFIAAALFIPVLLGKLKGLLHKDEDHVYVHHEHEAQYGDVTDYHNRRHFIRNY